MEIPRNSGLSGHLRHFMLTHTFNDPSLCPLLIDIECLQSGRPRHGQGSRSPHCSLLHQEQIYLTPNQGHLPHLSFCHRLKCIYVVVECLFLSSASTPSPEIAPDPKSTHDCMVPLTLSANIADRKAPFPPCTSCTYEVCTTCLPCWT